MTQKKAISDLLYKAQREIINLKYDDRTWCGSEQVVPVKSVETHAKNLEMILDAINNMLYISTLENFDKEISCNTESSTNLTETHSS